MKIFGLNNKGFTKNYLRIYGNMDLDKYSEEHKKEITEKFVQLATQLTNSAKLKFDIEGVGFGISKGSYIGQKAFNNKINKIGYKNFDGIAVIYEETNCKSGFSLFTNPLVVNHIDLYFSWPYSSDKNLGKAVDILKMVAEFIRIDYAYAYPTDDSLSEIGEGKITKGMFSFSISATKEEQKWNSHIIEIGRGAIKKIYHVNLFNKHQKDRLHGILPDESINLKSGNEIWRFEISRLQEVNANASNKILN